MEQLEFSYSRMFLLMGHLKKIQWNAWRFWKNSLDNRGTAARTFFYIPQAQRHQASRKQYSILKHPNIKFKRHIFLIIELFLFSKYLLLFGAYRR